MRGLERFDLINNSNRTKPLFDRNYIAPMIGATWCERYLIESRLAICPGYYLLPFVGRDLIGHTWVLLEQCGEVDPGFGTRGVIGNGPFRC